MEGLPSQVEVNLDAGDDVEMRCRDSVKNRPNAPKRLIIRGRAIEVVPNWLATFVQQQPWFSGIQMLRVQCPKLAALPPALVKIPALEVLEVDGMRSLKELPAALGQLGHLRLIALEGCDALQTPPPHVVQGGNDAVLQFLRDLAKGSAPCNLVKVVLVGEPRSGKSSLADSLVQRRHATRGWLLGWLRRRHGVLYGGCSGRHGGGGDGSRRL